MPLDHDARCEAQDRALALLEQTVKSHSNDIDKIVTVFDARHRTFQDLREQSAGMARDIALIRV